MLRAAWSVARKELLEAIREPTVLLFSLGFPILFYPLILWGVFQLQLLQEGFFEQSPPRVGVEAPAAVRTALEGAEVELVEGDADELRAGGIDLALSAEWRGQGLFARIDRLSTRPASVRAFGRVQPALDTLREERSNAALLAWGVAPGRMDPPGIEEEDLSPAREVRAWAMSRVIPVIAMVALLMSTAYPAVEVVVGERARQTIETTLLAAVPRASILLGKLLAVTGLSLLSVFGNLGAMLLTLVHLEAVQTAHKSTAGFAIAWPQLGLALVVLISTAILASAGMVLAALPASTYKQGQNITSNLVMVGMGGAILGVLPLIELDGWTALIPFGNATLVLRDAIAGDLRVGPALVALLLNLGLAALLVAAVARVAGQETWLFGARLPRWLVPLRRLARAGKERSP